MGVDLTVLADLRVGKGEGAEAGEDSEGAHCDSEMGVL